MPGWTPLSIGYYGVDGIVYVEKTIHGTNIVRVSIILVLLSEVPILGRTCNPSCWEKGI